ncbi:MAG: endo-1,4-beta-xylanase [Lachnospiraceae bacterium]|nr:endo-1,4-beta-xylanase [Lachnospiraceae bacterium]
MLPKGLRRKKSSACFLLAVVLILGTAGCGGKNGEEEATPSAEPGITAPATEPTEPASQPTQPEEPTKAAEPTEIPKEVRTNFYVSSLDEELPSLSEAWKDYFSVGVALTANELNNEFKTDLIVQQFNSMTCGNEMKPDFLLDRAKTLSEGTETCPVLSFRSCDGMLQFCMDNGIKMRGHTLVWHSQTPDWFFMEGYSNHQDAVFVSREVMLERMENYIRQVMEYVNTTYPGVVYAWDVVNEAIAPGDGEENGMRVDDSLWYQVIGPDFVEKAFEYARKYADPEQKLFYNDFNTYETSKRIAIVNLVNKIREQGNIDGIGMQSHIGMSSPTMDDYETAICKFAETGVEIHITELDIGLDSDSEENLLKEGKRYKRLFFLLKNLMDSGKANITNVTFWGLTDDGSWLNKDGKRYPLLFNQLLETKPAFWGVLLDDGIPLY